MLQLFQKKLPEEAAPVFNIGQERVSRRAAVFAAELELRDAAESVKSFQGQHYSVGPDGALVPKASVGVTDNFSVDQEHGRLVRSMSAAHDKFQAALKSFAEISE